MTAKAARREGACNARCWCCGVRRAASAPGTTPRQSGGSTVRPRSPVRRSSRATTSQRRHRTRPWNGSCDSSHEGSVMTEPTSLTIDGVIEDFRNADHEVPRESMQWALDNWEIAASRCLELLSAHAGGIDRTKQTENAVVFISRLVAEKEETAAFGDLCRLLRNVNVAPFLAA